jgi:hypothetical protein
MSINHTKLLSGRSQVVDYGNLTADRHQFLALGQAEPNLGPGTANSILTLSTNNTRVWTNAVTVSTVTATGNVSANYFLGNGSQLTGIITSVSNVVNGNSNLNIATANANVTISVSTVGNIAVFSPSGISILGTVLANGNISGGNLSTSGLISATGSITGGNILTLGLISATSTITSNANITGGNLLTSGLVSASGNITSGNVLTQGLITASGNITGNYFIGNGSQLTGIGAVSVYANALIGNTLSSNVLYSNLQTVGILENLSVSGNATISNISISNTTFSSIGNIINFAGNYGIGIPFGNSSQRPINPIVGVTRFNTTLDSIETWDGAAWVTSGNIISPGTIIDQQIVPDGSSYTYTLVESTTSAGVLVSINGINQLPNVAYNVTGNVITFTQTPLITDIIDIRFITYLTSVSSLSNYAGNGIVNVTPSGNIQFTTANSLFATMTDNSFNVLNPISSTGNITAPYFIGNIVGNISGNITIPGANTQVLYNLNGNVGAGSGFTFDAAANALVVTGNVAGGNLLTAGIVSATGSIISAANITGGNLITSGRVSANGNIIAGNIITAGIISAAGNVTYGNIFTSGLISVTGNATVGNITTAGLVSATGNATVGNITTSGLITATGNVAAGNIVSAGTITAVGNVTGNYFIGNGSQLTGITTTYGNANVANYLPTFSGNLTAGNISVTGNISGVQFIGSGNTLSNIQGNNVSGNVASATLAYIAYSVSGANVSGTVANATYATSAGTAYAVSGANVSGTVANATYATSAGTAGTAGTVTTNAQPNITSVGTLSSLAVTANVTGGNLSTSGQISATGNITTAGYFIGTFAGNISGNLTVPGSNTQVLYNNNGNAGASSGFTFNSASNAMVVTGNVTGGNLLTSGLVSATGNVYGNSFVASGSGGGISASGNIIGNYIIGNGATLSSIAGSNVTGIVANATYATSAGTAYAVSGANVSGTVANATYAISSGTSATVTTNAQPNITSVGTLSSLAVTANVTGGNLSTSGQISATGNITTAGYFIGTFAGNISGNLTVPGSNTQVIYNNSGNAGASSGFTFNSASNAMVVTGNVTGGNLLTGGYISATGNVIGTQFIGSGNTLANIQGANVSGTVANATYAASAGYAATVTTNAQSNITSVGTLTSLSVSGNISTGGLISSTGTITGSSLLGSVSSVSGNITGGNLSVGTGTVTVNNIVNGGASATGNIGTSVVPFNTLFATATTALYADLAENYLADNDYIPGTVLSFGGKEELTISTQDSDPLIAGVVSTNPAYQMNSGLTGNSVVSLALVGRVPCLVQGPVTAGAMMVSSGNGRARAESNPKMGTVIGKAITGFNGDKGMIEILVGRL